MAAHSFSADQLNTPDLTSVTKHFITDNETPAPAEKPKRTYTRTKANIRDEHLHFRVTKETRENLFKLADAAGVSQAEYISNLINEQAKKKGF